MRIEIPTYEAAWEAVSKERANPLEIFIHDQEPAGREDEHKFREELQEAITFVGAALESRMAELVEAGNAMATYLPQEYFSVAAWRKAAGGT